MGKWCDGSIEATARTVLVIRLPILPNAASEDCISAMYYRNTTYIHNWYKPVTQIVAYINSVCGLEGSWGYLLLAVKSTTSAP